MSAALQAAQKYLADLAAGRVVYREKPTAFQHGLIESLVAELVASSAPNADQKRVLERAYNEIDALHFNTQNRRRKNELQDLRCAMARQWPELDRSLYDAISDPPSSDQGRTP